MPSAKSKKKTPENVEKHDKAILQHDNAWQQVAKTGQDLLGNAKMASPTVFAVISRHRSIRLLIGPVHETTHVIAEVPFI